MSRQTLPQRELGKSGIKVSAVSLGCMSLSGTYGPSDDAVGIAVIHEALDRGVTMLDSSDLYGAGHNEQLIGKALAGRRDGVIVATKFGNLGGKGGKFADGRPEFVIASCEASLKRLGIDVIDLYYQHRRHGQAQAAGQDPRARAKRSRPGDHPPRPQGASARRRAERVFIALSRAG